MGANAQRMWLKTIGWEERSGQPDSMRLEICELSGKKPLVGAVPKSV
jgi:hypothetical protein